MLSLVFPELILLVFPKAKKLSREKNKTNIQGTYLADTVHLVCVGKHGDIYGRKFGCPRSVFGRIS